MLKPSLGFSFLFFSIQLLLVAVVVLSRPKDPKMDCCENLKTIDLAKNRWAIEGKRMHGTLVTTNDLLPYIRQWSVCPQGGTYNIGRIGENASYLLASHQYP